MATPNGNAGAASVQDDVERLRRILDKDEYAVYRRSAADADRFNLSEWIVKQLKKLFPSVDVPPGAGKAVEYGLIVLLLAAAVFAIVWISRQLVRNARLRTWSELQAQAAGSRRKRCCGKRRSWRRASGGAKRFAPVFSRCWAVSSSRAGSASSAGKRIGITPTS
ncbi:hypothetical protein SD70_08040 [Gordoniibacillus kamchatkensis]|uniref:Uncharacterized protein n=1 Tax=Gordoniibacillus kamchatkensis TaxID=1590651 RepID=A0ABR5AJS8_9BACL|nr:hypothetical protein [Paenibacillus sp. VKM B-2647]KIL41210.1 hypothetical protein SD70_08040 [Paenibacillus sp. VKM B-2647]